MESHMRHRRRYALDPLRATLTVCAWLAGAVLTGDGLLAAQSPATSEARDFKARLLSNAEFDALVAKASDVLIIDVRRPEEIARLGGFPVYLNIQADQLAASAAAIPRERTLITVSNHANRAGRAADRLASLGFKVAGAVGAQTYESQGGTLFRPTKAKPD